MKGARTFLAFGLAVLGLAAAAGERPDAREAMGKPLPKFSVRAPLKDAIDRFQQASGVAVRVDWPALKRAGVAEDAPVVVQADGAQAHQVLDLILRQAGRPDHPLAWCQDEETVRVTTQACVLCRRLTLETQPASGPAASQPAEAPGRLVSLKLEKIPAEKAFGFLRDLADLNLVVNWNSLEQAGIHRDTPISLDLRRTSLEKSLDLVCEQLSAGRERLGRVYWLTDRGVVSVATGEALNADLHVRVYDATNLVASVPDPPLPSAHVLGRTAPPPRELSDAQRRQLREQELLGAIQDIIGPDMWQPQGKGSIRIVQNKLIISQTPLGFKLLDEAIR